jgi:hypothetical protein
MNATPLLETHDLRQAFPKPDGDELLVLDGIELSLAEGQIVGLARAFGIGQVDAAAIDRRPVASDRRRDHVYGATGNRSRARHRDGVSELRAVPVANRAGERADRA